MTNAETLGTVTHTHTHTSNLKTKRKEVNLYECT